MQFIKLSEALKEIYSGDMFEMEFVTADVKRGTGGELVHVVDWQLTGYNGKQKGTRQKAAGLKIPNHDGNETFVIHNPGNPKQDPITVHIKLIQTYKNKRILHG